MEEKKATKISLSTFFLILALIAIIVMGLYIYKLNNEKSTEIQKSSELQSKVNSLNETVNDLQGKINSISKTIESNNSTENIATTNTVTSNDTSFTNEQVKKALSNYLEIRASAGCDSLLEKLNEKGKINYDPVKDTILNDGTVITSVKFSDYKVAMLNYVSESEFEKNWTSDQNFYENNNGYLTKVQGGGGLRVYTVNSIAKKR